MSSFDHVVLIVGLGTLSGFINALAAGGSAMTLPMLIFLGYPPHIANGSNRLALIVSGLTRLLVFHRARVLDWQHGLQFAVPAALGAVAGALIETRLSNAAMAWVITATVVLAFLLLITKAKRLLRAQSAPTLQTGWKPWMLFFVIGAWGGFIAVEAATFFLLALVLAVGYEFVAANAVKALLMCMMSGVSLIAFTSHGEIDWAIGGLLSCGTIVGSWVGAKLAVREQARVWVYRLLVVIVAVELIRLAATNVM